MILKIWERREGTFLTTRNLFAASKKNLIEGKNIQKVPELPAGLESCDMN